MEMVRRLCEAGEYPRQHLWGADALQRAGFAVEYGFFGHNRRSLARMSWRMRAGDLEQQAALLRRAGPDTVVYAGESTMLAGLARLRRAGWRTPVVAVVHTPDRSAAGLDVAICLSERTRDELVRRGRDPARTPVAPWGPDLSFTGYAATGEELVVSSGKTDRDVDTLLRALDGLDLPARVYADRPARAGRVEIVATGSGPPLPYDGVLADLRRASVVAIPLLPGDRLLGLSEVNEALALGKPIVMTRTRDFDPERIGCGLSVAPGDVAGWRAALTRLADDPALRARMGARGRAYAEEGYNAEAFGAAVVAAVRSAAAPCPPRPDTPAST